ncbi:O-antigen ligase family protein [Clostridium sp. JNZ X4-2]
MFLDRILYLLLCVYIIALPSLSDTAKIGSIGFSDCILAFIMLVYILKIIISEKTRCRFIKGIKDFFKNYLTVFMSIFAVMMLVSVSYASEKTLAVSESLRFISYIILFFMVKYEWNKEELLNGILYSYICSILIVGVYGLYQHFTGFGLSSEFKNYGYTKFKIAANMDNPNNLAAFLIIGIFPMIMLLIYESKKIKKCFYLLLTCIMFLDLAFTGSRNAIIGAAVGLIVLVVLYSAKFIIPLLAAGAISMLVPELRERIMAIDDPVQNQSRIYLWRIAQKMIKDHPVFGVGNGNYVSLYDRYVQIYPQYKFYGYSRWPSHNSYLKVESELGIIGGISFAGIIISSLVKVKSFIDNTKNKFYKYFYTGFFASMIAFYMMNLFDNLFFVPKTTAYFWLILAVSQGMMYREDHESIFLNIF